MGSQASTMWPGAMPPREKLLNHGAAALSDVELLAIFYAPGYPACMLYSWQSNCCDNSVLCII